MKPHVWNALIKRFLIVLAIASVVMFLIAEIAWLLQKEKTTRGPQVVELVIPAGTADVVAAGNWNPAIPKSLVFVVGDTLLVKNQDEVSHELGPLWIPAKSSASLRLDRPTDVAYTCSFQPTNYMGLTIREATTWRSRLMAMVYGVPPLAMFLLVYSFVVFPMRTSEDEEPEKKDNLSSRDFHPEWGWRQYEDTNE